MPTFFKRNEIGRERSARLGDAGEESRWFAFAKAGLPGERAGSMITYLRYADYAYAYASYA